MAHTNTNPNPYAHADAPLRRVLATLGTHLRAVPRGRWQLTLAIALLALGAWCTVLIPRLLGSIVDLVRDGDPPRRLAEVALAMVLAAIAAALLRARGFFLLARVADWVIADVRTSMVSAALGVPAEELERAGTADVMSRATDDIAEVSAALNEALPTVTTAVFIVGATVVGVASIDPRFLLVVLAALPVYIIAVRAYSRVAPARYTAERAAMAERARRLLESVHGHATLSALGWQERSRRHITRSSATVVTLGMRAQRTLFALMSSIALGEFILVAGTLLLGAWAVRLDALTVGAVTAAALMMIRLRGPVTQFMRVLDTVQSGYASLARVVAVIDAWPTPTSASSPTPPTPPTPTADPTSYRRRPRLDTPATRADAAGVGKVEVRDVSVTYEGSDTPALRGASFTLPPGHRLAVVGASGAGKSTLASVVRGTRTPDAGSVRIDGRPVAEVAPGTIGMLSQEVYVFSGSIAEDLRLAAPQASDADLRAVLDAVGAGEWAADLERAVGSAGRELQPHEAQQLALARMLLLDPPVVVLDEATAEAGSAHADVVDRAAEAVMAGRTSLVVAHRLDQAAAADEILVMDDGAIIERGTHEELLADQTRYRELWEAWHYPEADPPSTPK